MKIILDGILENISTRSDGTTKITVGANEMDASKAGELFQLRNKYVKFLISDSEITELEANVVDSTKLTGTRKKSQSSRLRGCLYRLWEQSGYAVEFENYYQTQMEQLIESVKAKLNEAA